MRSWVGACAVVVSVVAGCGTVEAPLPIIETSSMAPAGTPATAPTGTPSATPTSGVIVDTISDSQGRMVFFPKQPPTEGERAAMSALLIGDLVPVDGCLRVNSIYGDGSYLPIWPPEFTLQVQGEALQVLDGDGQVVARAGEEVSMGGGEGASSPPPGDASQQLPPGCTGPYWIVGTGVRPNLRRDSDMFALEVISTLGRSFFLLRQKPVLHEWAEGDAIVAGVLVLYADQRCLRVVSEDGLTDTLPLWPPDYAARVQNGQVEIVDGLGQVAARVGDAVRLAGAAIPVDWDVERYRRLYAELPTDCYGPYWIMRD